MKLPEIKGFLIYVLGLAFSVSPALAAPVNVAHVSLDLLSEREALAPGFPQYVGFRFVPEPGWHVYWKNPGESGLPPRVSWDVAGDVQVGDLEFPVPDRIPYGPLINYGYSDEAVFLSRVRPASALAPGGDVTLTAEVKWLACKEECVPGKATLTLHLPVVEATKIQGLSGTEPALFKKAVAALPAPVSSLDGTAVAVETVKTANGAGEFKLTIAGLPASLARAKRVHFFPEGEYGFVASTPQKIEWTRDALTIRVAQKEFQEATGVAGVLKIGSRGIAIGDQKPATEAPPASAGDTSLPLMLLFAFLGGLILNLMPCILPVLSIKALSIASQGGSDPAGVRKHGWLFTAGVFVSFWVLAIVLLALRATGAGLGWGFQLQSPGFVLVLAVLFFAMSLNLLGVFEFGTRWMGVGGGLASRGGYAGSFFTGVLTTVAATPCSAPFMGTALGFALTQSAGVAFAVLTALAAGLAFPYLAFSYVPAVGRALPKPGAWMKTFKELLAFPLLATSVWLLSVLSRQAGQGAVIDGVAVFLLVYAVIWLVNRPAPRRVGFKAGRALLVLVALGGIGDFGARASRIPLGRGEGVAAPWRAWSEAELADALKSKKTVFVDATADWCVTCKVNEKLVLSREEIRARLGASDVVALVADWTNSDEKITRYLASVGRNSVPVYLVYRGGSSTPEVLPQILSPSLVLEKLGPKPAP